MAYQDTEQIKKLIKLNEELENYFRNTVIPQLFVDADFILRKFTPPAMKQFDLKLSDIGRHVSELHNNIRFPTLMENIQEVIESGFDLEKEIQTTDLKWFQMNILPYIIQKNKKLNGVIITFIDITHRIKGLQEIEKLNADHETFIYSVSHDLKAPIINVKGLISSWKELKDKNSEESAQLAAMIDTSLEIVEKIISELGDISRTKHNIRNEPERVSFENILEDVKLILKENIQKSNAIIKTEINASEINFSRKNIRSILYNLLANAIKYKAPDRNPEIFIKTEKLKEYVLLSVTDNGIGIEENKRNIIFSEYTRISDSDYIDGTGIGLYIVDRMISISKGKIELESEVGRGSTFKIYFKIDQNGEKSS